MVASLDATLIQLEGHASALTARVIDKGEWHRRVLLTLLQRYPNDPALVARLAGVPSELHRERRTSTPTGTRPLATASL